MASFSLSQMIIGNGKYETTSKLGQGGFGEVFKGKNRSNGEVVAIKLIKNESSHGSLNSMLDSVTRASDPDKMAKRELQAVLELHHSNIVQLIDVGFDKDMHKVYIVMELCDGDLASFLVKKGGSLSETEIKSIAGQIVDGLQYIHREGMMHRDLKPANILMKGGKAKIADLGLVTASSSSPERATGIGTPIYMAPEVEVGIYGKKVDIFSLGLIIYEMLGGRQHFQGRKKNLSMPSGTSPAMQSLLAVMLNMDPDKRKDINNVKYHEFFN